MRDLKTSSLVFFSLIGSLSLSACKTQRPVVDIENRAPMEDAVLKTMDEETSNAPSFLKVSALSFPVDAIPYTRVGLLLQADGKPDRTVANYTLKDQIPVTLGIKYALTVTVYKSGEPIYSNQYCKNSNKFTARAGSNNYTVPMCLIPEAVLKKLPIPVPEETEEEGAAAEMIETPSAPGG